MKKNKNIENSKPNLRQKAYTEIRNAITFGQLKPGERLVERQICEQYNLGRTPFREALRQLETEGYIKVLPNRGAVISRISTSDVEHIYQVIAVLEGFAAELAVKNFTDSSKKELMSLETDLEKLAKKKKDDYSELYEKNLIFHEYFSSHCNNPHLKNIIADLRRRVYRYRFASIVIPGHKNEYLKAHSEILKAAFEGKSKKAGTLMTRHVRNACKVILDFIKKFPAL